MLDAIRGRLDDDLIRDAVARALALHRERAMVRARSAPVVDRELVAVEHRIGRLVDAIAVAGPVEELVTRLRAERTRKAALVDEQRNLARRAAETDESRVVARLAAHAADVRRLLGVHLQRTRQLLETMLAAPMVMVPIVEEGRRGYRFSGRLRLGGALIGASCDETRLAVVAPTGPNHFRLAVPLRGSVRVA